MNKMTVTTGAILAIVLLATSRMAWSAGAEAGAFLSIEGISGTYRGTMHSGWHQILNASWGHSLVGQSVASKAGAGALPVEFQNLTVVKRVDQASPNLARACSNGSTFKRAQLDFDRSIGGGYEVGFEIVIEDVTCTSYKTGSGNWEAGAPTESLEFSFRRIRWIGNRFTPDGQSAGSVVAGWDLVNHLPLK